MFVDTLSGSSMLFQDHDYFVPKKMDQVHDNGNNVEQKQINIPHDQKIPPNQEVNIQD